MGKICERGSGSALLIRVVKLPVIYVGGKLPVTYRPLPARMGHKALVLKGVGHYYTVDFFFLNLKFATMVCN